MKKIIIFLLVAVTTLSLLFSTPKVYADNGVECSKVGGACVVESSCTSGNLKAEGQDCSTGLKCCSIGINITKPINVQITSVSKLVSSLIAVAFVLAGLIAFAFLVWGGIQWITSGGDKAGVEAAQKRIQAALIGLLIVAASWAIMLLVTKFLGIDPFNFSFPTPFGD